MISDYSKEISGIYDSTDAFFRQLEEADKQFYIRVNKENAQWNLFALLNLLIHNRRFTDHTPGYKVKF